MRLDFREERVMSAKTPLELIFPDRRSRAAASAFVEWLRVRGGRATKREVSRFADQLQRGLVRGGDVVVKYSRRNFYMTVLRTLVDLGFLRRNVPVWDEGSRRTQYTYVVNIFDIPQKPPSVGFWRIAYYICRKWNEMFTSES